ncbi:MAG: hypothetical protein KDA42_12295 [Planctomycetales bacterium]|nr:hypothetical protein [Planctomycetales bacterium]
MKPIRYSLGALFTLSGIVAGATVLAVTDGRAHPFVIGLLVIWRAAAGWREKWPAPSWAQRLAVPIAAVALGIPVGHRVHALEPFPVLLGLVGVGAMLLGYWSCLYWHRQSDRGGLTRTAALAAIFILLWSDIFPGDENVVATSCSTAFGLLLLANCPRDTPLYFVAGGFLFWTAEIALMVNNAHTAFSGDGFFESWRS